MKHYIAILLITILVAPMTWAFDEKDIPPPPMPDYMKNSEYDAPQAKSDQSEDFNNEPIEDIKQEFLQAGQEDLEAQEISNASEPVEGPMESGVDEEPEEETRMVLEDPVEPEPIPEVNPVEVSTPEFQQAEINDPDQEEVRQEYLQSEAPETQEVQEEGYQQELAGVEQSLEEAEQEAEVTMEKPGREISSTKPFKAGMYKFAKECKMYSEASSMSSEEGVIRSGRKLWIDAHTSTWHKAYKKNGTVFIPANCLK